MISAGLAAIGAIFAVLKFILGEFSPESKLRRWELWYERKKASAQVEAERQVAANERIDNAPDKTGQDLVDDLNEKFKQEKPK